MKKIWPAMMLSLLLSSCSNTPSYQHVSMSEAIDLMNRESSYVILDVRTYDEYQQGHIPGAIVVPNETIGTSEIPELPDKQQMILVYCRSGNRSRQAAAKLAKLGYSNVIEFGGIIDWPLEIVKD
ncbi:MAG: rhodanese-like domain-containing protein [Erysipelotrichaceae bacterium]|nr:rhodanese-like domain-containing protein [Erysipelotrichaceae bacterium]